jgi:hypothetical protein
VDWSFPGRRITFRTTTQTQMRRHSFADIRRHCFADRSSCLPWYRPYVHLHLSYSLFQQLHLRVVSALILAKRLSPDAGRAVRFSALTQSQTPKHSNLSKQRINDENNLVKRQSSSIETRPRRTRQRGKPSPAIRYRASRSSTFPYGDYSRKSGYVHTNFTLPHS